MFEHHCFIVQGYAEGKGCGSYSFMLWCHVLSAVCEITLQQGSWLQLNNMQQKQNNITIILKGILTVFDFLTFGECDL